MATKTKERVKCGTMASTLTVALQRFTASFCDFGNLISGTGRNSGLWTNHRGQLYSPIYAGLMEAVLCPHITTGPGQSPS